MDLAYIGELFSLGQFDDRFFTIFSILSLSLSDGCLIKSMNVSQGTDKVFYLYCLNLLSRRFEMNDKKSIHLESVGNNKLFTYHPYKRNTSCLSKGPYEDKYLAHYHILRIISELTSLGAVDGVGSLWIGLHLSILLQPFHPFLFVHFFTTISPNSNAEASSQKRREALELGLIRLGLVIGLPSLYVFL